MDTSTGRILFDVDFDFETEAVAATTTELSGLHNMIGAVAAEADAAGSRMASAGIETAAAASVATGPLDFLKGKIKGAFAVEELLKFAEESINTADKIHDLSEATGVTAEDLSVMGVAAQQNGSSVEAMGKALGTMMGNVNAAAGGNKDLIDAFGAVGVSVEDLRSRSPRDLMLEIADGIKNMEDPAARAAAANKLLGDSSGDLMGTLGSLSGEGFAKVAEEADRMGLIVSGPAAQSADQFQKNLAKLSGVLMGAVNTIVSALLPVVNSLIQSLGLGAGGWASWLNPIGLVTAAIKGIGIVLTAAAATVTVVFNQLRTYFTQIISFVEAFYKRDWGKASDIAGNFTKVQAAQAQKDWDAAAGRIGNILSPQANQAEVANRKITPPPPPPPPKIDEQAIARNKELLATAEQHVKTLERQQELTNTIDAFEKLRVGTNHELQKITEKYAEKMEQIPASMSKSDQARLKSLFQQAEAMEKLKVSKEAEEAEKRLLETREKAKDAALKAADEAERTSRAATRNAELETLRGDKLKSSADVERIAALEREAAMDVYNQKIEDARTKADAARDALGPKPETGPALAIWEQHFLAIGRTEKATLEAATTQLEQSKTRIATEEEAGRLAVKKMFFGSAELEELAIKRRTELEKGTIEGEEQAKQITDRLNKEIAANQQMVANFQSFATQMGSGITNAIVEGLKTGNFEDSMKAIVKAFEGFWKGALDKIINKFMQDLADIAGGKQRKDDQGNPVGMTPTQAKAVGAGMAALAIGMDAYAKGAQPGGRTAGTLGGAMSGAMYGFQVYGPVGAVVGAVVGAIVGAIGAAMGAAAAREDYKYGVPNIDKKGNVSWSKLDDLSKGEIESYTAKISSTYREFWNGYTNILMKLPGGNLPEPTGITGNFQERASKNYLKHLGEWLENTLPREIAAQFKAGMKDAFQAAGVGAEAFDEFWKEAEKMDPKKALQFWSDLTEGLIAFDKVAATRKNVEDLGGNWADAKFLSDGTNRKPNESEFHADLRTQTQGIFDVARQMVHLAGPERAAAWKTLGTNVQQVMGSLTEYLNQVGEAMRGVKETIENTRFEWGLERFKNEEGEVDKEGMIGALKEQLASITDKIAKAAELGLGPGDVEKLVQQAIQLTDRIYQVDPKLAGGNDFRMEQLALIEKLSTESLGKMAEQAKTAVDKLMAEIEPFKDWFLGLTQPDIPAAMQDLENAFPGFKQAILDLKEVINNTAKTGTSPGTGTGTGTGGGFTDDDGNYHQNMKFTASSQSADGGSNVVDIAAYIESTKKLHEQIALDLEQKRLDAERDRALKEKIASNPINVTVNLNGTNVGVDELQANVTKAAVAGVVEAIRNRPTIIEHPFALGG